MSVPSDGLSLDQAPPLQIPVRFFVTAPVAICGAGALLLWQPHILLSPLFRPTLALTHLGTLGFLATVMLGALYQMLPVVAGAPVPMARLAHLVHVGWVLGVGASVAGLLGAGPGFFVIGGVAMSVALTIFVFQVGLALLRAPTVDGTVWGMRLATSSLVLLAALGLRMGWGHAGGLFPGARGDWIQVHLSVALLGWVGTLLMSVSWRIIPMFYLTAEEDPRAQRLLLRATLLGLIGSLSGLMISPVAAAVLTMPAMISVWIVHPIRTDSLIKNRRRKRTDGSLRFWQAGLLGGLCTGALSMGAAGLGGWVGILFGWVAIWGWAGLIVHGMLYRIVPFLVWFHRLSHLIGVVPVPPMKRILPDTLVQRSFQLHVLSLGVGVVAIGTGSDWIASVLGISLIAVGLRLARSLWTVLAVFPPEIPVE